MHDLDLLLSMLLFLVTRLCKRAIVSVSHVEWFISASAWLEAVERHWFGSAASLRDWYDFQKFLQTRKLGRVARRGIEAASQLDDLSQTA